MLPELKGDCTIGKGLKKNEGILCLQIQEMVPLREGLGPEVYLCCLLPAALRLQST